MKTTMKTTAICCASFLFAVACAKSQAPGTHPEDMSHQEHLAAAEQEREVAEEHEEQYNPEARTQDPDRYMHFGRGGHLWGDPTLDYYAIYNETVPGKVYNPTAYHKEYADKHLEHARQHDAAAKALAEYTEDQCADIHPDVRHLCPFMGTVESVDQIEGGARLHIEKNVDENGVFVHAECHHSYGAFHGYEGMPSCPLYLEDIRVEKAEDGAIEITSDNPDTAEKILERSKAHVGL